MPASKSIGKGSWASWEGSQGLKHYNPGGDASKIIYFFNVFLDVSNFFNFFSKCFSFVSKCFRNVSKLWKFRKLKNVYYLFVLILFLNV